jgi:MFS family permease
MTSPSSGAAASVPTPPAARDGLWSPARRPLSIGLVASVTLVAFEALAVSAILPIIARDLQGLELYGWVLTAFFLGSLVGIVVAGGAIDRVGLIPPYAVALTLFATGLILGGLAPSMPFLIGARFIQGLGGGALPPIVYVAIGWTLPERFRPAMFATLSTAWIVPGIAGPALAGFIAETFHWRWVLLGLLPLLAAAGTLVIRALRGVTDAGGRRPGAPGSAPSGVHAADLRFRDRVVTAVGVAIGAALVAGALQESAAPELLAALGIPGLILLGVGIRRLTPPGTLGAARGYPAAILVRGVLTWAFFAVDGYVTLALVEVRGLSATTAGLGLTTATIAWTAGTWTQARLAGRVPTERFISVGLAIIVVGTLGFALVLLPGWPVAVAIPTFGVAAFGMGLAYSAPALIVLREAPPAVQGSATSALSLTDGLGNALGTGVSQAFIAGAIRAGAGTAAGLGAAYVTAAVIGAAGLVVAARLHAPAPGRDPGVR